MRLLVIIYLGNWRVGLALISLRSQHWLSLLRNSNIAVPSMTADRRRTRACLAYIE
jgi:hypothetical protein